MPEMLDYLKRTGYKVSYNHIVTGSIAKAVRKAEELNALKVIHITGTKGKVRP
jgi:folylpolyglutamate synthase/dihydropteroate synthase